MENEKLLQDFSDREKSTYLGAIAFIATADQQWRWYHFINFRP